MGAPPPADDDVIAVALAAAAAAGGATLRWFRDDTLVADVKADGTPVTIADREAESAARAVLEARAPGDAVVGEEEGSSPGTTGRTWYVDPIDGTKAFTAGVPLYSDLVAVYDEHGPLVGVIHLPALGETVWAGRGRGAFNGDRPARVRPATSLSGAYVMTSGLGSWDLAALDRLRGAGAVIRTWGDGYGYALVATGRADAMIDPEVSVWDVAPMPVILAEAGGRFTDLTGGASPGGGSGLATAGAIHDELRALLAGPTTAEI